MKIKKVFGGLLRCRWLAGTYTRVPNWYEISSSLFRSVLLFVGGWKPQDPDKIYSLLSLFENSVDLKEIYFSLSLSDHAIADCKLLLNVWKHFWRVLNPRRRLEKALWPALTVQSHPNIERRLFILHYSSCQKRPQLYPFSLVSLNCTEVYNSS